MIATAHVMAGLVAGVAALSARTAGAMAATGFVLGLLTHVVLDAIPHSDYGSLSRTAVLISVASEIAATFALAWYLMRSRRLPGLWIAVPAGLAGAMIPDAKFARYFLPEPAGSWIRDVADRFHAPFHAERATVATGLTFEIVCTVLLFGAFLLLLRRQDLSSPATSST